MKKINLNLIPDCVNPSPDYYCTWQTQLYATCDGKPKAQRANISEKSLFNKEKPLGWAYFYEAVRKDLFLVMDDSWDVPVEDNSDYYGCLILNEEKFPKAVKNAKTNAEALKNLTDRIKNLGWKGLGGWVCAQESEKFRNGKTNEEYWSERLLDAHKSGFSYWKVDWGSKGDNFDFRKMLSDLGRKHAPNLVIEHAVTKDIIPYSDVFRTYDVPAIMSIPMTMEKLKNLASAEKAKSGMGLINCEDEVYIAAAGGFIMGIMRHPYAGEFMNGKEDMSFPSVHRNLKTKMYEVIRAVMWHRFAPAFNTDKMFVDSVELSDTWRFVKIEEEIEEWWLRREVITDNIKDGSLTKTAPARISRDCELPCVSPDKDGNVPYVIASKNPNGAFSVATLGRTFDRKYEIPKCDITLNIKDSRLIAAFGEYENLILETSHKNIKSVLMQDLADDSAYDITEEIIFLNGKIVIPGELIKKIGTVSQPDGDTSEPGVVIKIED